MTDKDRTYIKKVAETPEQEAFLLRFWDAFPAIIARKRVDWFTGGALAPKTVANDENLGRGPDERIEINGGPAYPRESFLPYFARKIGNTRVRPGRL